MKMEWVNSEGFDLSVFTPTKWISYAFTGGLIGITLVFLALYLANGMSWLVLCSCVCLGLLSLSLYYIGQGPDMRYVNVNFADVLFFMFVNVAFLGTRGGFHLYCFSFVTCAMFMRLTARSEGKVYWQSWLFIVYSVTFFIASTFWFEHHDPLYAFDNSLFYRTVYTLNAVSTMGVIALFTLIYMETAASLGQRLAVVASHDELTKLFNRRGFYPIIEDAFARNAGRAGRCSFAMLDIDHFKHVNDRYGHECGDAVLQGISQVLADYVSRYPELQAARWGGEEFLLMYAVADDKDSGTAEPPRSTETYLKAVGRLFDELRLDIARLSMADRENVVNCTVTIGVADFAEGATADKVINLADKRLYDGKQSGRNRVVLS